jgi:hypothetical protein
MMADWVDAVRVPPFTFTPLDPGSATMTEEQAIAAADRAYYEERWPGVTVEARYGLFDDRGRGTSQLPSGEIITHRYRTVWLVAFLDIVVRRDPPVWSRRVNRIKVIDAATGRVLQGFEVALGEDSL